MALNDPVNLSIPRAVLSEISELTEEFVQRMHELLERNTDGQLTQAERGASAAGQAGGI